MAYFNYNNKKVFYEEYGNKEDILVLLHGNTASSKMFDNTINSYINNYKVLVIDFLGYGLSQRVEKLNTDLWYDEARQVICLLDSLNFKKVNIIGSSGGAIVAINVALERPDLVNKVIADSFEGEKSLDIITNNIIEDREKSKKDEFSKMFYQAMNGDDWESVVDADTNAIYEHSKTIKNFYHKNLKELVVPILFTGSKEDEFLSFVGKDFYDNLMDELIKKVKHGEKHIFEHGFHPAMLSNIDEFVPMSINFLNQK